MSGDPTSAQPQAGARDLLARRRATVIRDAAGITLAGASLVLLAIAVLPDGGALGTTAAPGSRGPAGDPPGGAPAATLPPVHELGEPLESVGPLEPDAAGSPAVPAPSGPATPVARSTTRPSSARPPAATDPAATLTDAPAETATATATALPTRRPGRTPAPTATPSPDPTPPPAPSDAPNPTTAPTPPAPLPTDDAAAD